ncbi:MAG: DUF3800 domain-containing protein, partial [Nitrospiraceae bacterium]
MTSAVIYLDESGDLGWTLDQPYRAGGSSRYLTISALVVPSEKTHLPKRLIKDLYKAQKWSKATEKKWVDMSQTARLDFANRAAKLKLAQPDICYSTITVKKENVQAHIRADSNKLYNYMIKMLLLDRMAAFEHVTLIPDPRSIKVQSGNSLHDYLQTELWFTKNVATELKTTPLNSASSLGLQFS